MKYLIFGSTGLVGKNLIALLKEKNENFLGISRSGRDNSFALDITKELNLQKISFVPDIIVNCASQIPMAGKGLKDSDFINTLFETNVKGGVNITKWAIKNGVKKIINCSSLSVIGKPWPVPLTEESPLTIPSGPHAGYSLSKLSQEILMEECAKGSETEVLNLRISAVYGPGMSREGIIYNLSEKFKSKQSVNLYNAKKNYVDFIHVTDVCKAIYKLSKRDFREKIINLASGNELSIFELAVYIKNFWGSESHIKDDETEDSHPSRALIEITKLQEKLRQDLWEFIPFEKGLVKILE